MPVVRAGSLAPGNASGRTGGEAQQALPAPLRVMRRDGVAFAIVGGPKAEVTYAQRDESVTTTRGVR